MMKLNDCKKCGGTGSWPAPTRQVCPDCGAHRWTPVMYLDVDGVLWDIKPDASSALGTVDNAKGANGVEEFMEFAHDAFEVRWCTTWVPGGRMHPESMDRLAKMTGVHRSVWARVMPSKGWLTGKHENIDADEHRKGRPFVWVEDELLETEHQWLRGNHWTARYFHTNVFSDPDALVKTHLRLIEWLALEGYPVSIHKATSHIEEARQMLKDAGCEP